MDLHNIFNEEESLLIEKEFDRLSSVTYLDHTGCCLYPKSLIDAVARDLSSNTYSNPHSNSICSRNTGDYIDQVRFRVLQHFNTDQNEYSVVFTSGATAALKLVADSFDWSSPKDIDSEWHPKAVAQDVKKGDLVYLNDSHTSVLGMRNIIEDKSVATTCLSFDDAFKVFSKNDEISVNNCEGSNSLFVYSAQCNFSGFKYPLEWIQKAQSGYLNSLFDKKRSNWYCLLDAATFLSTNCLDLSKCKPDFVCLSFYKIFGYPTGLGALLIKNSSEHVLKKNYYGGGTVLITLSSSNKFVPRPLLHEKFEDGTLNFLSIISLHHSFNILNKLVGSFERVSRHCFLLAKYAFISLLKLHHSNGSPAVDLYNDTCYDEEHSQGGIVTFNLLRPSGDYIGFAEVLHQANLHKIQLRTGCFCNSGACWRHLGLSLEEVQSQYQAGHVCGDDIDLIDGRPTGAVRISFGYYTTYSHIDHFIQMINKCFVQQPAINKVPTYWNEKSHALNERLKSTIESSNVKIVSMNPKTIPVAETIPKGIINKENLVLHTEKTDLKISTRPVLSNIFLYPVKSCGALSVTSWSLDNKGLLYDRMWMVVNSTGVALTQKREPKMCLIKPMIDLGSKKLILNYNGHSQSCSIPLDVDDGLKEYNNALCQSKVCGDRIEGFDCGNDVALWLSEVLGTPGLRLVKQHLRSSKKAALSLANVGQYLLVNKTSVTWLSDQISSPELSQDTFVDRFRSNFVIEDVSEPFIEQTWSKVTIGNCDFRVDGGCNRCHMICIDQSTGASNQEPLTALGSAMKGKLKFGIYLSRIDNDNVCLSVGDKVLIE